VSTFQNFLIIFFLIPLTVIFFITLLVTPREGQEKKSLLKKKFKLSLLGKILLMPYIILIVVASFGFMAALIIPIIVKFF
jgi:hypothetical protein